MKRYAPRIIPKDYAAAIKKRPTIKDVEAAIVESETGECVTRSDALAAVSQARADALRWVLEQIDVTAPRHIDSRVYSIVDTERARLRAIIEKELQQ